MKRTNPFVSVRENGHLFVQAVDADSRIRMIADFTVDQCNAVLRLPSVQETVALAAMRRIRKLAKEAKKK